MILFKRSIDLQTRVNRQKNLGSTTGFVPTMGALHEGHIRLIETCREVVNLSICSIFVNPAQFNDPKDFEKYPVSIENDLKMLDQAGTDLVYLPTVKEVYPDGDQHLETYELGELETILEGRYRPGHFQGVCQVMSRLLTLIKPDHLFMGQKDFQQCLVVQKLIEILKLPIQFHTVPTIRESDGLAQSSRNRRLTADQRRNAVVIFQVLSDIHAGFASGKKDIVLKRAAEKLEAAHFKTDYISIARVSDLQPIENWDGKEKAVALIAAFQGEVRLIDNLLLN